MASYVYFAGTRYSSDTTWLAEYYGSQTSTAFEVVDSSGVLRVAFFGNGFTYGNNGFFNSGTVAGQYYFDLAGNLTAINTGLNVDVATRSSLLTVGTSSYAYYQYEMRGDDSFVGSEFDDSFDGSKGSDTIDGGSGLDLLTFRGFESAVEINLAAGFAATNFGIATIVNVEDLAGTVFGDVLVGNSGNNSIQGFGGDDTIDGGIGIDTAVYMDATSAINANLSAGTVTGGAGSDLLTSVERIIGSRFDDVLSGGMANEYFQGGFGNDTINGGGGVDTVEYANVGSGIVVNLASGVTGGGAGIDTLLNIENISGSIFNDSLDGNSSSNKIDGGNGNDTIHGGASSDILAGGAGNDVLNGGTGSDTLTGGTGNDTYVIDSASDVVSEISSIVAEIDAVQSSISFSLNATSRAQLENLTLLGTDNLNATGNAKANVLTGNSGNNTLSGLDGNDSLNGSAGNDSLNGGSGNDHLNGGAGNDTLVGSTGNDSLTGGTGNDTYVIDGANDVVRETSTIATEIDTVQSSVSYVFNLIGRDQLENLTLIGTGNLSATGNNKANVLTGNGGNNSLSGGIGNDTLSGGGGNDFLTGGAGKDSMTGGLGIDHFVFDALSESTVGSLRDVIVDFNHAQGDLIDLSAIDADSTTTGNQAFIYIGTAAYSGAAGQVHYLYSATTGVGVLSGDVNGDRVADFEIQLAGVNMLVARDLVL